MATTTVYLLLGQKIGKFKEKKQHIFVIDTTETRHGAIFDTTDDTALSLKLKNLNVSHFLEDIFKPNFSMNELYVLYSA
jgi:hypothetical protein